MFSDVIYNDELDNSFKLNLSSNRSYKVMFFECAMLDGTIEYHSGESIEKVLHQFPNINSLKQIKQEDYALLKEKQSHLW